MRQIKVSTPGKIHLMGEHVVVYGKPAVIAAIDKRCTVTLTPLESNDITITAQNLNKTETFSLDTIIAMTQKAQAQWQKYRKTNDISILKAITQEDMSYLVIAIGETFSHFQAKLNKGFHLTIDSEIPIGAGIGSSAAVSVSIISAVANFLGEVTDSNILRAITLRVEQKKHGNPSAGDVSSVVHGGLIWFRKDTHDVITVQPIPYVLPKALSDNLILIQSGIPEESTGEMVHKVALLQKQQPKIFERVLDHQEQLTHDLISAVRNADKDAIMTIIKEGEKNLEMLGVVSPSAKALIQAIEAAGGAAKICGAGGIAKGSGMILAYHKELSKLEAIVKENQLTYNRVALGMKGITIERV